MPQSPRVSVVIPTHNRPDLLLEALQSVAGQSMDDWEVVVVDDASAPPVSVDAAATGIAGEKLRVLRHESSRGGAAAKNTGAAAARGEVIAFLDDDDLYAPQYLARALQVLDAHPQIGVVFMGVAWFGSSARWGEEAYHRAMHKLLQRAGGEDAGDGVTLFGEALVAGLLDSVPMAFQRPVVRRTAFERIGAYRQGCLLWDCDWATRAALHSPTALYAEGLYRQRNDNQGFSSKPARRLEHMLSGVEIRETLLAETAGKPQYRHLQGLFREAAAKGWFDLAYNYRNLGYRWRALAAWWQSQKHLFRPGRFKFLLRLLLPVPRRDLRSSQQAKT